MKKLLLVMAVFVGMFMLTGCSESPSGAIESWMVALRDGDIDTANEYSTENVHALNALIVAAMDDETKAELDKGIEALAGATEEINGDTAIVTVEDGKIPMKKVDGKWKVNVEK